MSYRSNAGLRAAVERESIGFGAYAKSVARITITPRGGTPVEAVLYHGFYFAAPPYVDERKIQYTAVPRLYVVRGYDAGGKLIYTSPLNGLELFAEENACYLDPAGRKVVGWSSRNPHPDPKTCRRTVTWNWLGR